MSLYDDLTDKGIILKVADLFYDKVYEDPWLSLYFKEIDQEFITAQQVDFIVGAMGGPQKYSGRLPSNAHPHMFITEEL
ncbi:MAG: group 1 truncated hemoglobin, partial [Halobacteriovoraceae bacterium]|nr:group 1 truncated hemoglobin [Halobacteriovoraceae bacterium]